MKLWRSFVVLFSFVFFGAGSLFLGLVFFPVVSLFMKGEEKRNYLCNVVHKTWRFFTNFIEKNGSIKLNVSEKDLAYLRSLRGKIIVSNHPSYIDILLIIGLIPNTLCMAKKELKKNLVMSNIVSSLYLINDEDKEKLKKEADEVLKQGYNIVIFPTGTRTLEGEDMKLHKGAAMIAINSDAEIVPLHISCDYKFLAKNQKIYDAGEKTVNYIITVNEKIVPSQYKKENLDDIKFRNLINSIIKERILKLTLNSY